MSVTVSDLEQRLREDPDVQLRLNHDRDVAAATAAIAFFTRGERLPKEKESWYASQTWQYVLSAFQKAALVVHPEWISVVNDSTGSLKTGARKLRVGDVIELRGENKCRFVTFAMGTDTATHSATFKNQGLLPKGSVEWRLVATATPFEKSTPVNPPLPPQVPPGLFRRIWVWIEGSEKVIKVIGGILTGIVAIIGAIFTLIQLSR